MQSHGFSMTPVSIKQLSSTLQQKLIRSQKQSETNWTAVSNTMVQTKSSHQQMKVLILRLQTTERRMEYTLQGWKIPSKERAKAQIKDQ
jgi:hypothetical protein